MRRPPHHPLPVLVAAALLGLGAGPRPEAVSPGHPERYGAVASTAPTFSWGMIQGALEYDLVIYAVEESVVSREPVIQVRIPGSATSWTPDSSEALRPGGLYAWTVRSGGSDHAEWSEPLLFRVEPTPSGEEIQRALELLHRAVEDDRGLLDSSERADSVNRRSDEPIHREVGDRGVGDREAGSEPRPATDPALAASPSARSSWRVPAAGAGGGISLRASGDISSGGDYLLSPPRSRTSFYSAARFRVAYPDSAAYDPVSVSTTGPYAYITSGSASYYNYLLADVDLPDGASVDSMTCYYYDNSAAVDIASDAYLYRRSYTDTGSSLLITLPLETTDESSSEMRTGTASPAGPLIIDNAANLYFLRVYWYTGDMASSLARFYGCGVSYSVDRL